MQYFRAANERGHANHGWLDSHHSFSFASYYDPAHMGVSVLRVINDDVVAPGMGFGTHGHQDMEIISYVLKGSIEHKDSMGHVSVLKTGEVQRMSAGTGVRHSEYNPSRSDELRFLQIWVLPNVKGIEPDYEQREIPQNGSLTPLVTPKGSDGSLRINQDASLYRLKLAPGEQQSLALDKRTGYLHVISGAGDAGSRAVAEGDGLGILQEDELNVTAGDQGIEALWFDLPKAY